MASSSGSSLGSGGAFFPQQRGKRKGIKYGAGGGTGGDGAGGASSQGGAGGGGRGGHIHVYDHRNPPDYGRIPWPEDIFGSLEVDSDGSFVDVNGRYQESGTYRMVTRAGLYAESSLQTQFVANDRSSLGLSSFLRAKLVHRLKKEAEKL